MILLVGGAGFIGSHVADWLVRHGEKVVVFDDFSLGHRAAVAGLPVFEGSATNIADLKRAFSEYEIHAVVHLASFTQVGESVREPDRYWHNNVVGAMNLLNVMRDFACTQLVFSSTAAVYGEPLTLPITEEHPVKPTSTYGNTKLAIELMIADYGKAFGLRSVILRYFNATGTDPSGRLGEDHDPETHLIPAAILSGMGKTAPLAIFGTDYPTRDGTCVRDYVHVNDLAQAHALALKHLQGGGESRTYNLGNGHGYSVREVVECVRNETSLALEVVDSDRRAGDPHSLVASSDLIKRELGWSPEFSDLQSMVQHAWNWRKRHPDGY